MDAQSFQIGNENDGDVILRIICSDGVEYEGNPLHLHSHVLNKSKFFEARLSERWSSNNSPPEIKLTVLPNGAAENYIKCICLMYSSYKGKRLYFSGVNEALDIFTVASELLFEEGIEACMQYLEAVPWTPQQTVKIRSLLSSLQVNVSADLFARLRISNTSFVGELNLLKETLPEMLSTIRRNQTPLIPLSRMRLTVEQHLIKTFEDNAFPAIQEVFRDAIINEIRLNIDFIMGLSNSACENVLWLLDITKLCNIGILETTLKMFVEDAQLPDILLKGREILDPSFSDCLLQILVDRYMKGLVNGDIIVPKSFRMDFLRMWVPVMAYLICNMASFTGTFSGSSLIYSEKFVGGVTKVVGTLPPDDQKELFMFWTNSLQQFRSPENEVFQWWIHEISLAVTSVNKSSFGTE